ncbi:MAG: dihydrolipoamide dehydrogenase [Lentimonas sp.]|jgi:dihydrolipoamide dehydrogenase
MNSKKVEIAIIGTGSAGMKAYREASKTTQSIILIEGTAYGTTCARVGCMPSKLLIAASEAANYGHHAQGFGITYGARHIDGKKVMDRVRNERDRFVGFVVSDVEDWPKEHKIFGQAKFESDHILNVKTKDGDVKIEADKIIIATGSRPRIIDSLKSLGDRVIINDDLFDFEDLPKSIAVFGAGVIALELGQALHRLGVRTKVFGRTNLGPISDPSLLAHTKDIFNEELDISWQAEFDSIENLGDEVEIKYESEGRKKTEKFEYILAASGRVPNLDDLGLKNTSIKLGAKGIPNFNRKTSRIDQSHIFIAGDVNNALPLLHEAADDGKIAGFNAAHYPNIKEFERRSKINVMFCDPQIMSVGDSYKELKEKNIDFKIGEVNFKGQGRSRVMLVNKGMLRVYGDAKTGKFLGAEMAGPRAENIAHLLAWSHQSGLTVSDILDRPFYHPVIEEGVRTAFVNLQKELDLDY